MDVVTLARRLIDIDSTTGNEGEAGRWLAAFLRSRGFDVVEQPVEGERVNLIASCGAPRVVFSTHYDCVPPFFPSREESGRLIGRGACDAKGILAAQVTAADRLRMAGETRIGLLFVVGEERGSDGARAANTVAPKTEYLVNGEPTDNRLGIATRGVLRVRLQATGRAAHSSYPEQGESAIEKLIDALIRLRELDLPEDPEFGRAHYTVGLVSGGIAPNVVPPSAHAEVLFRTVGPADDIRRLLATLEPLVRIGDVLEVPPVRLERLPGFSVASFPYTTDIPFLDRWGRPLLLGPGSVLDAHTEQESVSVAELRQGVELYVRIGTMLLAR